MGWGWGYKWQLWLLFRMHFTRFRLYVALELTSDIFEQLLDMPPSSTSSFHGRGRVSETDMVKARQITSLFCWIRLCPSRFFHAGDGRKIGKGFIMAHLCSVGSHHRRRRRMSITLQMILSEHIISGDRDGATTPNVALLLL